MSYILDALKRADAERERGAVPGLHARPVAPLVAPAADARKRLALTVATAVVLGGIATGLAFWRAPAEPPVPAPAVAATAPPRVAAPAATALAPPTPAAVIPAAVPTPAPVAAAQAPAKPKPDLVPKVAVPAVAAPAAVALLSELTDDLRRQVPALAITGAVYSENPTQRLLLVNNQVLTQGSVAAPEVTLEEIRPTSSVFSFRGTRFRVAH